MKLKIIYEDKEILVVVKPPQIPSQPDKTGDEDMVTVLSCYLAEKQKKKEIYLGLVHRLDRPVGGIMVFAKTKEANQILSEQIRKNEMEKGYKAVLCGNLKAEKGELRDTLLKNERKNMSSVVSKETKNAKEAILTYEKEKCITTLDYGDLTLVKISLQTGRHHQIRVQFSYAGYPLWGDSKYNSLFQKKGGWHQIALWSGLLVFSHPKTKERMCFEEGSTEYPFTLFN